jgi:tetratricopeptide (TPR) repeat protein
MKYPNAPCFQIARWFGLAGDGIPPGFRQALSRVKTGPVPPPPMKMLFPLMAAAVLAFATPGSAAGEQIVVSEVNAVVEAIPVKLGDRVKAGDVLAKLDATAILREAEQAKIRYKRTQALHAAGTVSDEELAKAETYYRFTHDRISKFTVTAPVDGTVAEVFCAVGEALLRNSPVVKLTLPGEPSVEPPADLDIEDRARANDIFQSGHALMNKGDYRGALDRYLESLEIAPDNWLTLVFLGQVNFRIGKYGDCVWSYEEARRLVGKLGTADLTRLGVAYLVLGDYRRAYDVFDKAHNQDPEAEGAREWRIAAAFGNGDFEHALNTLIDAPPREPREPANYDEQRIFTYNLIHNAISFVDGKAGEAGLSYPRLTHLSLLSELLNTAAPHRNTGYWRFMNIDIEAMRKEQWDIIWAAIKVYRSLPIKPVPPKRAIDKENEARQRVLAGDIGYRAFDAVQEATVIAPWWPEARYNLAVLARDSSYTQNLYYSTDKTIATNGQIAAQEFIFFVSLAPSDSRAGDVRKQLKEWGQPCPQD